MTKMFERLSAGDPAIGTIMMTPGADWVELLGYSGLDLVCVDFMASSITWTEAANQIRAMGRYRMTPWIRLQSYPFGTGGVDTRLAADVERAFAIGAEAVTAAVNTPEEVATLIGPVAGARRQLFLDSDPTDFTPMAFPLLKTQAAINNLNAILEVKGLKAIFLGMGDLSADLGHARDDEHPAVQAVLRESIARAAGAGVAVFANLLAYKPHDLEPARLAERVRHYHGLGVKAIWLPRPQLFLQRSIEAIVGGVRKNAGDFKGDSVRGTSRLT